MRLTLPESGRSFLQPAECCSASILAHVLVVWFAVGATAGGKQMPTNKDDARVFFLLPPDRVDTRDRQTEVIQLGKLGGDLEDGKYLIEPDGGPLAVKPGHGARGKRERSGARGQLPFGPPSRHLPDTAFSVLEVDEMVRYEESAAPIYPRELLAIGAEGLVRTEYVVDTSGMVDTTTIRVMHSDDPRFTESVRTALGGMRFRPAKRAGKVVRQLVQQRFRFKIVPSSDLPEQIS